MPTDTAPDPAEFRRQATKVFRIALICLAALAIGSAWVGWRYGGVWGLAVGSVVGLVVAGCGVTGATLLYAMSQDGA